jgi:SAM-dependent methyltransferase
LKIVRLIYHVLHKLLFWLISRINNKVKRGHISKEHLQYADLDKKLCNNLTESGLTVKEYSIDVSAYKNYIQNTNYPVSYYGGGMDPKQNFTEKTLEHFVSFDFLNLNEKSVFIDIAACTSPFYTIVREKYSLESAYQQDLVYEKGLHGDKIGGYASEIPFDDNSVDAVSLHCSLEHFEGESDISFFKEMQRVLKPGGRVVVLPFYLAYTYTIHLDPAYNLIKLHKANIDKDAEIRYCEWKQFFSRHYDVNSLWKRIVSNVPQLLPEIYFVRNYKEVDDSCYLRFIGVFTKK